MERRLLIKTTLFHAFKKKEGGDETVSFWGGTVSSSSSPGRVAGEEKVLFSSPWLFLPTCSVTTKTRHHLHLLMMRKQRSRALQAMPPLATSAGAAAVQETCAPCIGSDGMGLGRPRSPCPYKYHLNAREKKEKKKAANGERNRKREKPTKRERNRSRQ